jgi:hypothetical protein
MFLVTVVDTTVLPNNELLRIRLIENTELNKYHNTELQGLGRLPRCAVP